MSLKLYTDIVIQNDRFFIHDRTYKTLGNESALSTLSRIEEVIRKDLKYSDQVQNEYAKLSRKELLSHLLEKAKSIRDGYTQKKSRFAFVKRLFGRVTVSSVYDRIEKLVSKRFPFLVLPRELIQHIFSFLPINEIEIVAKVNKSWHEDAKEARIERAREYGYHGRDFSAAQNYLHKLFQTIALLAQENIIPTEYIFTLKQYRPFCQIDSEAIHRKITHLSAKKANTLKPTLNNALFVYVENNRIEIVKVLLKYGANPNIQNDQNETPLQLAMYEPNEDMISLLLSHGADPNIASVDGFTPLCINTDQPEITELLCKNRANVNHQVKYAGNYSALHFAVLREQIETIRVLLRYGANPNILNKDNVTPLHLASRKINNEMTSLLLSYKADPNIPNVKDKTSPQVCTRVKINRVLHHEHN